MIAIMVLMAGLYLTIPQLGVVGAPFAYFTVIGLPIIEASALAWHE